MTLWQSDSRAQMSASRKSMLTNIATNFNLLKYSHSSRESPVHAPFSSPCSLASEPTRLWISTVSSLLFLQINGFPTLIFFSVSDHVVSGSSTLRSSEVYRGSREVKQVRSRIFERFFVLKGFHFQHSWFRFWIAVAEHLYLSKATRTQGSLLLAKVPILRWKCCTRRLTY